MRKKISDFFTLLLAACVCLAAFGTLVSCREKTYSYNASYTYDTVENGVSSTYVLSVDNKNFRFVMDVSGANEISYTGTFTYKNSYLVLTSTEKGVQYAKLDGDNFLFFTPDASETQAECVHTWDGGVYHAGDCTNLSYTVYTCTKCGKTKIVTGELGSHVYDTAVHTDGDCKNYGYTTYTCSVCGASYKVYDTVYGSHKYVDDDTVIDAGCLSECYTRSVCSVCGDVKKTYLGYYGSHNYDANGRCVLCGYCNNGFSTKHADANGDGLCDVCGYPMNILDALKTDGYCVSGNLIYYGCYPQTHCSDITPEKLKSDGIYDKETGYYRYNGESYALRTVETAVTDSFEDGTSVIKGGTYVFLVEPVAWRIMKTDDGNYTLLSNVVLDRYNYLSATDISVNNGVYYNKNGENIYANNWEYSAIRDYLNGDFIEKAFSTLQTARLAQTAVDNKTTSKETNSYTNAQFNTSDKVFLPSYADINSAGFTALKISDYAIACGARGIKVSGKSEIDGYFITRSAASLSNSIYAVSSVPELKESSLSASENYGFAPMLILRTSN
jgi:hypothetical protein